MTDGKVQSDGSASVCTKEDCAPIRHHWYASDGTQEHRTVAGQNVAQALRQLLTEAGLEGEDRDRVMGEVSARMKRLVQGKLLPIHHVKGPMETVTGIDLFEVRTQVYRGEGIDEVLVRVYHVEPVDLTQVGGSTVVGLHMHLKDVSDPKQVRSRQDEELQHARKRYFEGRGGKWGGASLL
ncbi:hypothetical protein [Curtobacterium sp. Leaf154]|uniref:hypothetical protein n=1 Tax=Curtobacterium sp. Leaf154 TaxID=1736277 RepID=UPI0012E84F6D|nr:hypothetical protein [Curtobacterium sp. Leaf154]